MNLLKTFREHLSVPSVGFLHGVRSEFTYDVSGTAVGPIFGVFARCEKWIYWRRLANSCESHLQKASVNSLLTPCKNPQKKRFGNRCGSNLLKIEPTAVPETSSVSSLRTKTKKKNIHSTVKVQNQNNFIIQICNLLHFFEVCCPSKSNIDLNCVERETTWWWPANIETWYHKIQIKHGQIKVSLVPAEANFILKFNPSESWVKSSLF